MSAHIKLFIPGPGDVDEQVLEAMAQPLLRHYGPTWTAIYADTQQLVQKVFGTSHDIFIVPGPGTGVLDMAIGSLLPSGSPIVVCRNGFFGLRLTEIAEAHRLRVVPCDAPTAKPIDPGELRRVLAAAPEARVVTVVHHETGTTVLNPLQEIAAVCREFDRVLVVDAVSSLGGTPLPVDAWGIDVCITAPNKCLEGPPGVGLISVSPRAWSLVDDHDGGGHGWYLNLRTWRQYAREWGAWHPTPVTISSNTVMGVRTSLQRIVAGGIDAHIAKYARAGKKVRSALTAMGFEPFIPESYAAPMVTAFHARPEFTVPEFVAWLLEERQIAISGGLADLAGKIFRVGHLGKASGDAYIDEFVGAVRDVLMTKGLDRHS